VIESRLGRDTDAVSSFRNALDREPDGYAAHFFLARALAPTDLEAARAEANEALRLNPLDFRTRGLARRLERQRGP
jgi:cytochrome c-type biogenesis protein CcmH/NrfG